MFAILSSVLMSNDKVTHMVLFRVLSLT